MLSIHKLYTRTSNQKDFIGLIFNLKFFLFLLLEQSTILTLLKVELFCVHLILGIFLKLHFTSFDLSYYSLLTLKFAQIHTVAYLESKDVSTSYGDLQGSA